MSALKTLWNVTWYGLYGTTGLFTVEAAKANSLPSPQRQVALASLCYTASNKHRQAIFFIWEWVLLLLPPLIHYALSRRYLAESARFCLDVTKRGADELGGRIDDLSAGGCDVLGTIFHTLGEPFNASIYLKLALAKASIGSGPAHERALPLARLALLSVQYPDVFRDMTTGPHGYLTRVNRVLAEPETNPQQMARVYALLTEYHLVQGSRDSAICTAEQGRDLAKMCGATTQLFKLRWLLFKARLIRFFRRS